MQAIVIKTFLTILSYYLLIFHFFPPVDTGCKLNVLCTFNLRPVSTGLVFLATKKVNTFIEVIFY